VVIVAGVLVTAIATVACPRTLPGFTARSIVIITTNRIVHRAFFIIRPLEPNRASFARHVGAVIYTGFGPIVLLITRDEQRAGCQKVREF